MFLSDHDDTSKEKTYILPLFVTITYMSLSTRFPKPRLTTSGLFPCDLWRIVMNRRRRHVAFSAVGLNSLCETRRQFGVL